MKKTLIALAAVAATGAAFAQSSVTLYGVADLSLADTNVAGSTWAMSGNGTLNNGSSRLGVRGVEDLGGGLKAAFNFEQGINAETGATDTAAVVPATVPATTTPATFQRAANMSLMGGFGTVKLGRTLTPSFFGVAAWELTGTANYSVVASQFSFAGGPSRNNSELSYTTPNMGGFSAQLGYVFKADNAGNAKVDMNAIYRGGPVTVALSANKVQNSQSNYAIGGKYDFGMFQVAGSLQNPAGVAKGFTIGAGANLGPVSLVLDVARDTHFKDTDVLVEAKYPLSKRTFAYAAFQKNGAGKAATSVNTYGLGIRHNF